MISTPMPATRASGLCESKGNNRTSRRSKFWSKNIVSRSNPPPLDKPRLTSNIAKDGAIIFRGGFPPFPGRCGFPPSPLQCYQVTPIRVSALPELFQQRPDSLITLGLWPVSMSRTQHDPRDRDVPFPSSLSFFPAARRPAFPDTTQCSEIPLP
jgi:hypothetical protein